VKIDNPKGAYYGGLTAAPVTKSMLQQALASHRVAIDRSRLMPGDTAAPSAAPPHPRASIAEPAAPTVVVPWPDPGDADSGARALPVPDVAGESVREAALALHRRGFRVELRGIGRVTGTTPPAGQTAAAGSAVTVWTGGVP